MTTVTSIIDKREETVEVRDMIPGTWFFHQDGRKLIVTNKEEHDLKVCVNPVTGKLLSIPKKYRSRVIEEIEITLK